MIDTRKTPTISEIAYKTIQTSFCAQVFAAQALSWDFCDVENAKRLVDMLMFLSDQLYDLEAMTVVADGLDSFDAYMDEGGIRS